MIARALRKRVTQNGGAFVTTKEHLREELKEELGITIMTKNMCEHFRLACRCPGAPKLASAAFHGLQDDVVVIRDCDKFTAKEAISHCEGSPLPDDVKDYLDQQAVVQIIADANADTLAVAQA